MAAPKVQKAFCTFFTIGKQGPSDRSSICPDSEGQTVGLERPEALWPRERPKNGGRSSPTRCFARGQSECLSVCNVLLFGHLRKDRGDSDGDVQGDLGLLRSSHPATLGKH